MQVLAPMTGLSLMRVANHRLSLWIKAPGCCIAAGSNPVVFTMFNKG